MTRRTPIFVPAAGIALIVVTALTSSGASDGCGDSGPSSDWSSTSPGTDAPAPPTESEPEEPDIYKLEGNRLYIINRYRGLVVVDVADRKHPHQLGRLTIPATPRELWVKNGIAYVVVSDEEQWGSGWGRSRVDVQPLASWSGSAMLVVDARDAAAPELTAALKLDGDCYDGRLIDTHLIIACQPARHTGVGNGHLYSIDVSDATSPRVQGDLETTRSLTGIQHMHVGSSLIYVSTPSSIYPPRPSQTGAVGCGTPRSEPGYQGAWIELVDISNPAVMVKRGRVAVRGAVIDRFAMNEWQGHLRVATTEGRSGPVHAYGITVSDPDAPRIVGETRLELNEALTAARFDGPRGYIVTYRQIDPLFVVDFSNPKGPRVLGELEMSGWLDFMVPVGDRVVALGHDDVGDARTLAISLIDVGSSGPALLARQTLQGGWGWIPAGRDDYNKVFRVMPEAGLVLFPYRTYSATSHRRQAGLLVVGWKGDQLEQLADIQDIGLVERGFMLDGNTLATLSTQMLRIIDLTDRRAPEILGTMDLARQVNGFVRLNDDVIVEVSGDIDSSPAKLIARPAGEAGLDQALSELEMEGITGRIFARGSDVIYVSVVPQVGYGEPAQQSRVIVVDYADPRRPVIRSTTDLGGPYLQSSGRCEYYWGTCTYGASYFDGEHLLLQSWMWGPNNDCVSGYLVRPHLAVVDLSDAAHPRHTTFCTSSYARSISGHDGRAYLVSSDRVQVVDLTGEAGPSLGPVFQAQPPGAPAGAFTAINPELQLLFAWRRSTDWRIEAWAIEEKGLSLVASVSEPATAVASTGTLVLTVGHDKVTTWTISRESLVWEDEGALPDDWRWAYPVDGNVNGDYAFLRTADSVIFFDVSERNRIGQLQRVRTAGMSETAEHVGDSVLIAGGYRGLMRLPVGK